MFGIFFISAPLAGPPELAINFTNLEDIQVEWENVPAAKVPGILIGFTVFWQVFFNTSDLAPNTLATTPFPVKKRRWRRSVKDYFHKDIDTSL